MPFALRRAAARLILAAAVVSLPKPSWALHITFKSTKPAGPFWPSIQGPQKPLVWLDWTKDLNASFTGKGYYKGFSGDRRRATGLRDRLFDQEDLVMRYNKTFKNGIATSNDLALRRTNDRTVTNHKDMSLQNLLLSVEKKDRFAVRLGNIMTNFSRYVLGTSLQGVNGYYQRGYLRVSAVAATKEPYEGRSFRRWTTGGRVEVIDMPTKGTRLRPLEGVLEKASFGLSSAFVSDDTDSLDNYYSSLRNKVGNVDSSVYGADTTLAFRRKVKLQMELAASNYRDNLKPRKLGEAFKSELSWDPGKFTSNAVFEQQNPDFRSPAGSASPDQRRFGSRLGYTFASWAKLGGNAEFTRNNLRDQLAAINFAESYASSLDLSPFGWLAKSPLKGLGTSHNVRLNRSWTSDRAARRQTVNYDFTARQTVAKFNYSAKYSYQNSKDLNDRRNDRITFTHGYDVGYKWDVYPKWKLSLNPTYGWSLTDESVAKTNIGSETMNNSVGLNGAVDGGRFDVQFKTISNQRPGANSQATFKTQWNCSWTQNIIPRMTLAFRFAQTQVEETDRTKNYNEDETSLELKYEF